MMLNFTSVSDEAETTMYIGFLLEYVVHLLMFCHVAHQIRTQASVGQCQKRSMS